MKQWWLIAAKAISFVTGFFGALALVRVYNSTFDAYLARTYPNWPHMSVGPAVILLAICLAGFVLPTLAMQPIRRNPLRNTDFSLLMLLCGMGFAAAAHITQAAPSRFALIGSYALLAMPMMAYTLAMLALGELLARLRDKRLLETLHWLAFFRAYPIWKPMGLATLLLLASQAVWLALSFVTPVMILPLFAIAALTRFASYLLNLGAQYTRANADKIRAERFRSELITNVSHDIKTPLTSIINFVDLLGKEPLQGQAAEHVRVLEQKSGRLKVLIDDLMEASKASTGNLKVELREIVVGELLGQVAGEFEDQFAERNLTLVLRQPDEPVRIQADSRHLYRALENLFSNAAKYALEGTRVFAEITLCEGKPQFALQNTSQAPIELTGSEATAQFIRGDRSRQTEGSDLGLYIAKSLVELMGGELSINITGDLFRVEVGLCALYSL